MRAEREVKNIMIYPTVGRLHTGKVLRQNGPAWLRATLLSVLAGLIIGICFLQHATRKELAAAGQDDSPTVSPWNSAYGTTDPYGFGPRANAAPGTPGGAANQESLSSSTPSEPPDSSEIKLDKN